MRLGHGRTAQEAERRRDAPVTRKRGRLRYVHPRSAAVLGCGFEHRPGARLSQPAWNLPEALATIRLPSVLQHINVLMR
jgi:hypothetical protein